MLKIKTFYLFALILLLTSCAYFNTYYNANKLFKEAQEIGFDEKGRPKSNAIQKYNKVIKKCGVILTDYKDSKWADDALFLLASSFFYKGNSYTLAIEKFNDIINFYPDSKYVPDSYIYIARANYRFNKKELAYQQLQNFITEPLFEEKHPEAMLVLANYYLENDDLVEANYYFQQIIDKYPDSNAYQEAFFLQGKTQHIAGNYQASNQVFTELLAARIDKKIKLDARYYIALNLLLLEKPEASFDLIKELKKDEYRTKNLPKIQLLEARCLSGLGDIEAAIETFKLIKTQNKKTLLAAEASYYLAETYFTELQDYDNAIEAYSDVKNQDKNSEYVELAVSRSSVIGEIIQYNNPDTSIPTRDLVTQKLRLAEYYIEVLNMPDSALSIYNKIATEPADIETRIDTLLKLRKAFEDSSSSYFYNLVSDTLTSSDTLTATMMQDSIATDSLNTIETSVDTTRYILIPENDSLKTVTQAELDELLEKLNSDLEDYRTEYIPFARFVKTWIYTSLKQDTLRAELIYEKMLQDSPENQYTLAAQDLISGKEVELLDDKVKEDKNLYENIQDLFALDPDSAYVLLTQLSEQENFTYYNKVNFSLGLYYYDLGDTNSARLHFDRVLEQNDASEFKREINKIYNGSDFLVTDRLRYFIDKEAETDSLEVELDIEPDTTETVNPELVVTPRTDSLNLNQPAKILNRYDPPVPKSIEVTEKVIFLEIEVLAEGIPGMINILNEPEFEKDLVKYIEATVRNWQFQPALENGVPVKSTIKDQLKFDSDRS